MKIYLFFIKTYLNFLSIISPKHGGKVAFKLFQKVRKKDIRQREKVFYTRGKKFTVPFPQEELHCYEFGNIEGELVFLVHGWDSNAGSLSQFAFELEKLNYRIISFDLPAHANSNLTHTNLFICKNAFKTVIDFINPKERFSVISHSFGSALSAYSLSENNAMINKYVMLTSNNSFEGIFLNFQNTIRFNSIIYRQFSNLVSEIMGESISEMRISKKVAEVDYKKLLLIHDTHDKIIPFKNSEEINESVHNSALSIYKKIGHYRMLFNKDVIKETIEFIDN